MPEEPTDEGGAEFICLGCGATLYLSCPGWPDGTLEVLRIDKQWSEKDTEIWRLRGEIARLRDEMSLMQRTVEASMNLSHSEPEFDDARIDWVSVQVDRDELKAFVDAKAALVALAPGKV